MAQVSGFARIASHQVDQFLFYTGSTSGEVIASSIGNFGMPDKPAFQDFGEVLLRSDRAAGYVRVDWFTPDGLPVGLQVVASHLEDRTADGHSITLKIDGVPPTITPSRSPAANANGWNNTDVKVDFS